MAALVTLFFSSLLFSSLLLDSTVWPLQVAPLGSPGPFVHGGRSPDSPSLLNMPPIEVDVTLARLVVTYLPYLDHVPYRFAVSLEATNNEQKSVRRRRRRRRRSCTDGREKGTQVNDAVIYGL